MKFKNTLIIGLATLTLISCNDFLDVDSPSSYNEDFVFSQETEISRALNGVYASILVGDLYGSAYQKTFNLNSDVDMQMYTGNVATHNSYARFDCDDQGGEIDKYWRASYKAIEDANRFIRGVETGPLYNEENTAVMQMLGEAKCLRAMVYHDLVVMFGDVPFTFLPASQLGDNYVIPVMNREEIQNKLIEDLQDIAPKMSSTTTTTVERASKEFAWALIARIALTAGGYSLHPDKNNANSYGVMKRPEDYQKYYQIVKEYTSLVIASGTHSVGTSYQDIFTKESNFEIIAKGDPIFEIPFAKESTGNTGYSQGPTSTVNEASFQRCQPPRSQPIEWPYRLQRRDGKGRTTNESAERKCCPYLPLPQQPLLLRPMRPLWHLCIGRSQCRVPRRNASLTRATVGKIIHRAQREPSETFP